MSEATRFQAMLDEYEIQRVRRIWAYGRDHCEWEVLTGCFHADATVIISWYSGSALGFVERSKQAAASRKPEERSQHWLGNFQATVNGDRALLESDVQILSRDYLDGYLFDCTCYGRFLDRFERRDGVWRIARWTCVYDMDRLDPVFPEPVPSSFYDGLQLEGEGSSCAYMRLRQKKKGRTVPAGLIMGGSDAEKQLKRESHLWLNGSGA